MDSVHIKDIIIKYEADNYTKYGLFALLAWFIIDILGLHRRFNIVSVKKKRNNAKRIKRRKSRFSASKICVAIVSIILLGIKRFRKINNILHDEKEIAKLIGLEKFFDQSTVHIFLNEFQLWHIHQLDQINTQLLVDFGDSGHQDFPILDVDTCTHSLESRKRQKAIPGYNKKNRGKPCYQWFVGFIREEVVDQKLNPGNEHHSSKDFQEMVFNVQRKFGYKGLIIRADSAHLSAENLNFVVEYGHQIIVACDYDYIAANNHIDENQWFTYDGKTRLLDLGEATVVAKCEHKFRVILVEKEQEQIKIRKRKKYYRYAIISNIFSLKEASTQYEFYHERQTLENFFKESQNPFNAGKMPSQLFRANQAYLLFVVIAYNSFTIFKKNICQHSGRENLLKLLEIKQSSTLDI